MAQYRIAAERSRIWAEARSSLHPIRIESSALEGTLELEVAGGRVDLAAAPKGSIGLDAGSLETGNRLEDRELARQLRVREYPRVHGEVRGVSALDGQGRFAVRGDLSLRGVTRSLEGEVRVRPVDDATLEIEGEKTIDVREFGLRPPKIWMLRVYPEIRIRARIVAVREG